MGESGGWFVQEGKRGQTVLHEAVNRCDTEVVNAVVNCSSLDVNFETYDGLTALDMAISRRWNDGSRVLVQAGGRISDDQQRNCHSPIDVD